MGKLFNYGVRDWWTTDFEGSILRFIFDRSTLGSWRFCGDAWSLILGFIFYFYLPEFTRMILLYLF